MEVLTNPEFDLKSYAVGKLNGKVRAIPLEEAVNMKRDFKEELVGLINVLSK